MCIEDMSMEMVGARCVMIRPAKYEIFIRIALNEKDLFSVAPELLTPQINLVQTQRPPMVRVF
jgi:hypothetical protein